MLTFWLRKTYNGNGVDGMTLLSKTSSLHVGCLQRSPACSTAILAKYSVNRLTQNVVVWNEHNTVCGEKNVKTHQHQSLFLTGTCGGGMGLLGCLRAWMDSCHRCKCEVPSLSRCFAGKLKTICLPSEAQQRMGDATGQKAKAKK